MAARRAVGPQSQRVATRAGRLRDLQLPSTLGCQVDRRCRVPGVASGWAFARRQPAAAVTLSAIPRPSTTARTTPTRSTARHKPA